MLLAFCGLLLLAGVPSALGALKKQRFLRYDVSCLLQRADCARASLTSLLMSLLYFLHNIGDQRR